MRRCSESVLHALAPHVRLMNRKEGLRSPVKLLHAIRSCRSLLGTLRGEPHRLHDERHTPHETQTLHGKIRHTKMKVIIFGLLLEG